MLCYGQSSSSFFFFEDLKTLRIESVEIICAATDHIAPMIEMIETLLKKGIAYKGSDGGIYYSIERFPSYGRLSRLKLDDLKEGASNRVAEDEYDKESASDFVLWKPYDQKRDGDVFWESPFGKGRPGWHIECSAMATHYLGETIDLHLGGVDNIFPHHENEIAQSEGCSGKHFVRHWIHVHHLIVDGKKMSKSLGNFYTLRDLLAEGYTGEEVRYLLLSTHYRTRLNFTLNRLDAVRHTLARFSDFIHRLKTACGDRVVLLDPMIERCRTSFTAALGDDLNISVALASLFELIKEVNPLIDEEKVSTSEAEKVLVFLEELNTVLAVLPLREKEVAIPPEIREAVEKRQRARIAKDWVEADKQREFIRSQGFAVEDGPSGPRVKRG
ncbi:MAG: cysteine--tRNA ligase [Chlamydiota bacterium]